ncbi:Na+/H+ antiporter [Microbacterium bovistercoris]|uniref:Na+/H+ antiporter n=1 Tax=Microbacterium bovistercoris TaxID=2293570 RepID=UPI001FEB491E|nr:Na+/H+ antiporter [Microbacterium bovistercoris]
MIEPLAVVVIVGTLLVTASWFAPKLRMPAPLMQLLFGLLAGFLPAVREIHLPPEVVLVLFLPALLFWEALTTSLREVRRDMRVILLLSIPLVIVTAAGVAATSVLLGWGILAAVILGASLAPTDATAVGALARSLPHRNMTVLRAESLVNDGTALVLFGLATAVAVEPSVVSGWKVSEMFVVAYAGGVVIGLACGYVASRAVRHVHDATLHTIALFLVPFIAFLIAEHVHSSGVIAVVVAGLLLSQSGPRTGSALSRRQLHLVGALVTSVLNGALFVLIGIEAQSALRSVPAGSIPGLLLLCVLVWLAILAIRFVFQVLMAWCLRLLDRRPSQRERRMTHRARAVSTIAGFRGAVSLAVALAVPVGVGPRDEIIFVATGVVILTLVVQGALLPGVMRWAGFGRDTSVAGEITTAQRETTVAALEVLPALAEQAGVPVGVRDRIVSEYQERLARLGAATDLDGPDLWAADEDYAALELAVLEHKRGVLVRLRDERRISDTALRIVQARLDRDALRLAPPHVTE